MEGEGTAKRVSGERGRGTVSRRGVLAMTVAGAGAVVAACGRSGGTPAATPSPHSTATPTTVPPTATATAVPPTPTVVPSPTPLPATPSLEEMAGQLMVVAFDGQDVASATEVTDQIRRGLLGAVVLFYDGPRNIASPQQVAALTSGLQALSPGPPLMICCDEEGGAVARLDQRAGFPPTISEQAMASAGQTSQAAGAMAQTMRAAGLNLDLAPVVDTNVNPSNPAIGAFGRSFSADPQAVAANALQFVDAMHAQGILCTLKHFPGQGSAQADTHKGFVDVTAVWSRDELIPFRSVIQAGKADAVMVAHTFNSNIDPTYPGTLSHATVTGLLRGELGFTGVAMSDSMTMQAITDQYGFAQAVELSINAGMDMLSYSSATANGQPAADAIRGVIVDAVNAGRIPLARVQEAYGRVMALRARAVG